MTAVRIASSPALPGTLLAMTRGSLGEWVVLSSFDGGIYRNRDAGATWERVTNESGELITPDFGTNRLLWVHSGCLKASSDEGATWISLRVGCK